MITIKTLVIITDPVLQYVLKWRECINFYGSSVVKRGTFLRRGHIHDCTYIYKNTYF